MAPRRCSLLHDIVVPMVLVALESAAHAHAAASTASGGTGMATLEQPGYHFTRANGHMNDPNGLMWRTLPNGSVAYHMYFQSQDPGDSTRAPVGGGSIWGHTVSHDLVRWIRLPRTGMKGSSGGGVALPPDFVPPAELAGAKAIAISSVPMSPSLNPPTGLHLWYSTDEGLLAWSEYRVKSRVQNSTNQTCVICPKDVPASLNPGYIGDNYVWTETAPANATSGKGRTHTFYVLSGSNRCAQGHPWCSYGGGSTPQAFVFKSTDLLHWEFVADWDFEAVRLPSATMNHIDTPDTFALLNADTGARQQVVLWLAGGHTQAMLGSLDPSKVFHPASPTGEVTTMDRGAMFCQQSLTTPQGARVSLGWVRFNGGNAQSLPRVVTADATGMHYAPLPALETLHEEYHFWRHHSLAAGTEQTLTQISAFGARAHIRVQPSLLALGGGHNCSLTLSLLGGATKVVLERLVPAGAANQSCAQNAVHNNSDTTGPGLKMIRWPTPANATGRGPGWCQALCCATTNCGSWTFADPQPCGGAGPCTAYDCWLKGPGALKPSSCGNGHCYSGQVSGGGQSWRVRVDDQVMSGGLGTRPVRHASSSEYPDYQEFGVLDVFVDGPIVEVYFDGAVLTAAPHGATSTTASIAMTGGQGVVRLDAWRMQDSITGGG